MSGCFNCKHKDTRICKVCVCRIGDRWELKPLTHADELRAMSDEELAEYLRTHASLCPDAEEDREVCKGANFIANDTMCRKCWLDWLRQEADND